VITRDDGIRVMPVRGYQFRGQYVVQCDACHWATGSFNRTNAEHDAAEHAQLDSHVEAVGSVA